MSDTSGRDPSLIRFRTVVASALEHLESRRQEINDLNVFPVADGDTGDNMTLTLRAVVDELDRLLTLPVASVDDIGRDQVVESVARAALLGARGNSGVILSQMIAGATGALIRYPGRLVDPVIIGSAMAGANELARLSVRKVQEGTMLTVMGAMALAILQELPRLQTLQLGEGGDQQVQDALLADVLEPALRAGEAAVRQGPELLPVLKEAGVVDAGGHGVTIIFAGVIAALRGTEAPEIPGYAPAVKVSHPEHESSTYRYCTNFAVTGKGMDAKEHAQRLEELGDSVLVVGDEVTLKVHVHTDEPERATGLFSPPYEVSHLDVADMHEQVRRREQRFAAVAASSGDGATSHAPVAHCGVLAVVSGDGLFELFANEGASPLDGGPTMNPSTYELLAGIHDVDAEEVVVLPNSSNVFMAAERAAELSDKRVSVVATRSQQAGLAIVVEHDPSRSAEENAAQLREALTAVRTGGVARAAREDPQGRYAVGDAVGFVEDELVAWGQPAAVLADVVGRLAPGAEIVDCLAGVDAPLTPDEVLALDDTGVLELSHGGQSAYWWLLSAV